MTNKRTTLTLALAAALALFLACPAWANPVSGPCSNCHIMHNSQDSSMVDTDGPNEKLLTTDCVGCHSSSSGGEAISSLGAPIVYNTSAPTFGNKYKDGPNQGLAGGNFYFVEHVHDNRGHNVMVDNPDDVLATAPSHRDTLCGSKPGVCHQTLSEVYTHEDHYYGRQGCTKCHMLSRPPDQPYYPFTWHHLPQPTGRFAGAYSGAQGTVYNWYRHLAGPHPDSRAFGAVGYEDPDWELTFSASDHNDYRESYNTQPIKSYSVSGLCSGCHWYFHQHPSQFMAIPDTGEYANAFGPEHTYDPLIPVGQPISYSYPGDMSPKQNVELGVDKVMCLSCHRAHGSPYPDMLRFEYDEMQAGGGDGDGEGCFKCHTQKDGS